jgi:DNA repair protein RecN (Recombination protein N)
MLQHLFVQNYALIDQLSIGFDKGLTTITGETGAGKSILVGALSLILGQRADKSVLKDDTKKCIVEATVNIKNNNLTPFFNENDIDYNEQTIIRREISPNGKSRAFINDTPYNINTLRSLGLKLIDIHSQHYNLELNNNLFQLKVIDTIAQNQKLVSQYYGNYKAYRALEKEYHALEAAIAKTKADKDYFQYQYEQLEKAHLDEQNQEELEHEVQALEHAEDIKTNLSNAVYLMNGDEQTLLSKLSEVKQLVQDVISFYPKAEEHSNRIESAYIELKDIAAEIEMMAENIEHDPQRLILIKEKLDAIYNLQQKHHVATIDALITIREDILQKLENIETGDSRMEELKTSLSEKQEQLHALAMDISNKRKTAIPILGNKIKELLLQLGIPNASFKVLHEACEDFTETGIDRVNFLFSANKKMKEQEISKIASGGELSRLMLSIKYLVLENITLPTVIFDEIDAGVSGDIADKMGNIIKAMAEKIQVVNITHLPQIASKGNQHFLVYKYDDETTTHTGIKLLNEKERITEIAKMLSGEDLTDAAINNAKVLLGENH